VHELDKILKEMRVQGADAQALLAEVDADGNGVLDFDEFVAIFNKPTSGLARAFFESGLLSSGGGLFRLGVPQTNLTILTNLTNLTNLTSLGVPQMAASGSEKQTNLTNLMKHSPGPERSSGAAAERDATHNASTPQGPSGSSGSSDATHNASTEDDAQDRRVVLGTDSHASAGLGAGACSAVSSSSTPTIRRSCCSSSIAKPQGGCRDVSATERLLVAGFSRTAWMEGLVAASPSAAPRRSQSARLARRGKAGATLKERKEREAAALLEAEERLRAIRVRYSTGITY